MITPIDLFNKYIDIFVPTFINYPKEVDGKYTFTLTETDPAAKLKKVVISDVPQNTILLDMQKYSKLNMGEKMKDIINDESGFFKCCDYLLVSERNSKLYMIFIEMKSSNIDKPKIISQFKGASCFMVYCNAIIERFYNIPDKISDLQTSYALLSWGNMNKKPTVRKNKYRKPLSPENYIHRKAGKTNLEKVPFEWFISYE